MWGGGRGVVESDNVMVRVVGLKGSKNGFRQTSSWGRGAGRVVGWGRELLS